MSIFISGSLAYDYIMDVPDRFARHILPDQLHKLSLSFAIGQLRRSWGGTAGNIGYTTRLLGANPLVVSALGKDGADYIEHFKSQGVSTGCILRDQDLMTAGAHIMTDLDNNQITAFFPGPLGRITEVDWKAHLSEITFALVTPNPKEVMLQHLQETKNNNIKNAFDPGQALSLFSGDEIKSAIELSMFVIGNDYEMKLMEDRTGWSRADMLKQTEIIVTTLGAEGSIIHTRDGQEVRVRACETSACVDPTGAGDAFRAGFFVGYDKGLDLQTCAQIGSVAATYAVEVYGTQAHAFSKQDFCTRYQQTYSQTISL